MDGEIADWQWGGQGKGRHAVFLVGRFAMCDLSSAKLPSQERERLEAPRNYEPLIGIDVMVWWSREARGTGSQEAGKAGWRGGQPSKPLIFLGACPDMARMCDIDGLVTISPFAGIDVPTAKCGSRKLRTNQFKTRCKSDLDASDGIFARKVARSCTQANRCCTLSSASGPASHEELTPPLANEVSCAASVTVKRSPSAPGRRTVCVWHSPRRKGRPLPAASSRSVLNAQMSCLTLSSSDAHHSGANLGGQH